MERNVSCSLCGKEEADKFCICADLTPLGPACWEEHLNKAKAGFHFALPLAAKAYVTRNNLTQYKQWLLALIDSQDKLKANLSLVDRCYADIQTAYEGLIQDLINSKEQLLSKVRDFKAALTVSIAQAIEETTDNAYRHDYQPSTSLAQQVWAHSSTSSSQEIQAFSYEVKCTDERLRDSLEVTIKTAVPELAFSHVSGGAQVVQQLHVLLAQFQALASTEEMQSLREENTRLRDEGTALAKEIDTLKGRCQALEAEINSLTPYRQKANQLRSQVAALEENVRVSAKETLSVTARDNEELRQVVLREQEKSANQELVASRLKNRSLSEVVKCLTSQPIKTAAESLRERKLGTERVSSETVLVEKQLELHKMELRLPQRDEEDIVVQHHERSRLMPLISLTSEPLAQLVNVDSILPDFPSPFYPIVITGYRGKSSLLQSLLGSLASCESRKDDLDGLYMWPKPVLLGTIPVLLLKLRQEANYQSAYLNLRRKVMACVMSLSSVWCICEGYERTSREAMESFFQTYSEVKAKFRVRISKVFVFVRKDWFRRPDNQRQLEKILQETSGLFEIRYRGAEGSEEDTTCFADFARELAYVGLHAPFMQSHQNAFSENFRDRYIALLKMLTHVANLDVDYATFLAKTPNLTDSDSVINSKLKALRKAADIAGLIKSSGKALDFIILKQVGRSFQPVLHEEILTKLQKTYAMSEPTIVLSVMGLPGYCKSTFLNSVAQYCTEATECRSIFKAGNISYHKTFDCQVLSHPLRLGGKQLMLIDLEGLGSTEIREKAKSIAQINLVKAVMTISSVFVIIVPNNEREKLEKAESDISMFAQLNKDSGFATKRVYLLCPDREESKAFNSDFTKAVKEMNDTFFGKQEVVKLKNKPNFVEFGTDAACKSFLQALLTDCAHFKAYSDGRYVNILDLLTELASILQHNLEESVLNPAQCQEVVQRICSRLQTLSDAIVSENNVTLLPEFERMMESSFRPWLEQEISCIPPVMHNRCRKKIQHEENKIKSELALCESRYRVIRAYSQEHMLQIIQTLVDSASDVFYRIKDLGHLLENIKTHFPQGRETLTELIERYETAKKTKIIKSTAFGGTAVVRAAQAVFPSAMLTRKAQQLLDMKNSELKADTWKIIAEMPTAYAPMLLFIGSKSAYPTAFSSAFLRNIVPFTPVEFNAFDPNEYAQILPFEYFRAHAVSRAYVICLRMKKKQTSQYAQSMLKVAETLLPAASLTCIFSDRPDSYTESLLMKFRNIRPSSGGKIVVFSSSRRRRTTLNPLLRDLRIPSELKRIEDFTEDVITICAGYIQQQFDAVNVSELGILLRQIALLPVSIRSRPILSDSALRSRELIYVNSTWGNGSVNDAFWKMCSDNPSPYAPVVLVIGSKSTSPATFADRFLQLLIPGASATFDTSLYTQVLCFDREHATTPGTISRGYLICLRMKKKITSNYSQRMLKIAENLPSAASLTCLLSDRLETYFEPLLNALSEPRARASYPTRRVICWHTAIQSHAAAHLRLHQIQRFDKATIIAMAQEAKQEFDTTLVRDPSFLLERVSALPTIFQD